MADEMGLYVRFNLQAVEDRKASERDGRPVFKNVEYVEIHVPGDKTNIPHRPVTDEDRSRFATTYAAWKRGQGDIQAGQPLKEWPAIRPAEVAMLAHANVHTVEALAALSDENISRIGPVRHLVARAKDYMEASRSAAPVAALQAELEKQRQALAILQEELQQARAARPSPAHAEKVAEGAKAESGEEDESTTAPKRRGRPPKGAAE
jgi:hypothetical protein